MFHTRREGDPACRPVGEVTINDTWGRLTACDETDDAKALFQWFAEWHEFMDIEATPLVEDADAGAVLQSLYG